jgi:hypothetical protein
MLRYIFKFSNFFCGMKWTEIEGTTTTQKSYKNSELKKNNAIQISFPIIKIKKCIGSTSSLLRSE